MENSALANSQAKKPAVFWLAIIFGVLLIFSILANFALFSALAVLSGGKVGDGELAKYDESFITGDRASRNKILRIPVEGAIMENSMVTDVVNSFKKASEDKDIKAVILEVDSPGGGITACDRIYNEIKRYRDANPNVPMVVSMKNIATSGGYYVSMLADKIIANPTSITGSIGVIMYLINVEGLYEKIGLSDVVIKSGAKKDMGLWSRKMTDDEKTIFHDMIMEMYDRFVGIVAKNRKAIDHEMLLKLADGRAYTGEQALKNGLVDKLGDFEDSLKEAKSLARIYDAKIVEFSRRKGLLESLFNAKSNDQNALTESVNKLFIEKKTPQFLYMWTVE